MFLLVPLGVFEIFTSQRIDSDVSGRFIVNGCSFFHRSFCFLFRLATSVSCFVSVSPWSKLSWPILSLPACQAHCPFLSPSLPLPFLTGAREAPSVPLCTLRGGEVLAARFVLPVQVPRRLRASAHHGRVGSPFKPQPAPSLRSRVGALKGDLIAAAFVRLCPRFWG